jgi:hypothetical protein
MGITHAWPILKKTLFNVPCFLFLFPLSADIRKPIMCANIILIKKFEYGLVV